MKVTYKSLDAYDLAFKLAVKIFHVTKTFPREEIYSLTDQIRRSSRSVCANIAEGYRKRQYPKHFASKISDSDAECSETLVWLDFSLEFKYISNEVHRELSSDYQRVGSMLGKMMTKAHLFIPKS